MKLNLQEILNFRAVMEDVEPISAQYRMDDYNRRTTATPLRRPSSSGKYLELTPLWETVIRYDRLPHNIDKIKVFSELGVRLNDPEWEVRQHALRVLVDLIPVIAKGGNEELDSLMIPVVLTEITYNLGHVAPAVRKSAHDVIIVYLKASTDPEFVLRSIVTHALESPAAKTNLITSAIMCLPELLQTVVMSSETSILGHQTLVQIVSALSRRLNQMTYQHHAVQSVIKIREVIGESRFDHFLENYYPQVKRDLIVLCNVYQIELSNIRDSGIDIQSNVGSPPSTNSNRSECEAWSESSTSPVHNIENDERNERAVELNISIYDNTTNHTDVREDDEYDYADSDYSQGSGNEDVKVSSLSTDKAPEAQEADADSPPNTENANEVKNNESNEENESNEMGVLLVENVQEEEDDDTKRTPRRVRFGGEVVKLRTPDSDTVEVQEQLTVDCSPTEEPKESCNDQEGESPKEPEEGPSPPLPQVPTASYSIVQTQENDIKEQAEDEEEMKRPRSSHIPLPIVPASKRPQDPRKQRKTWRQDPDSLDGVESLTSSSEGEQSRNVFAHQFQPDKDIEEVSFFDKDLKERLLQKVISSNYCNTILFK